MNISVLGAGAWGTALAIAFAATSKHRVTLWSRDHVQAATMRDSRENARYLDNAHFPDALTVSDDIDAAIHGSDVLIGATPSHGLRALLQTLVSKKSAAPLLWVCKGFDRETGLLPHETVAHVFAGSTAPFAVGALSGPSGIEWQRATCIFLRRFDWCGNRRRLKKHHGDCRWHFGWHAVRP
jgi:glycerol-3-phosphate dehydrogenase (NAD(P)+)